MAQRPILDESTVALTFDDVLLAPRAVRRAAGRGRRQLAGDARDRRQDPRHLLGHGHGDRGPARHRHGAGRRHRRHPPQPDARGAGRAGGAWSSATSPAWWSIPSPSIPTATLADALRLMDEHNISGIPVVEPGKKGKLVGILTNRDVRFATNPKTPVAELMTKKLVTVKEGVEPRGRPAAAASAPHREAAGGGRRLPLHRPHHGQGHREGAEVSQRLQGRAGPAAGGGGDHASATTASSAPSALIDAGVRPGRGRHRARPLEPRAGGRDAASRSSRTACR